MVQKSREKVDARRVGMLVLATFGSWVAANFVAGSVLVPVVGSEAGPVVANRSRQPQGCNPQMRDVRYETEWLTPFGFSN